MQNQRKESYIEYFAIKHATQIWLEDIFGHDCYITLEDEDEEEFQELITARKILEHIKAKATDEPIDITARVNKLGEASDTAEPLEHYFQKFKNIQTKLKNTKEPQSDIVLKRHAKTQLLKLPHIQRAVNKWCKEKDKDGKKSSAESCNFMLEKKSNRIP